MRACVTGGAGFIGSHLADRLVRDGWDVVVLDDLSTGRRANLAAAGAPIDLHVADLRDADAVARAVAGSEVIFHLGALASVARSVEHPAAVAAVNLGGTLHVLQAAQQYGVRRVVFASSSSVYGDTPDLPKREDHPLRPRSPYAASKAGAEAFLQAFRGTWGLEAVILRFFNVYGPRQPHDSAYAGVVPIFARACLEGRPLLVQGDGGQTRDFTYVADVTDAVVRAAEAPEAPQGPINIGAGRRASVLDLAAALGAACGIEPVLEAGPARTGDVRDSEADIARAGRVLGWRPTTSLEDGLRRTLDSLRTGDRAVESPR